MDASRFRRPHSGSVDDEKSWRILSGVLAHISAQADVGAESGLSA